jgi:hypothetical protein
MYAPSAEINPIRADVDVDMNKKLSGESQGSYLWFIKLSGDKKFADGLILSGYSLLPYKYNRLKSAAAYKAVTTGDADVIVHPQYVIERHRFLFFSTVKIKVTGYAGKFKKFYQVPYIDPTKKEEYKIKLEGRNLLF